MRTAIVEGVEYIDLEEDIAGGIPRFGKTKRIVSYHNFRKTPDDLAAIHAQLCSVDADVVKLATMANQPHDNLRMLQLVGQSKQPTVGFCMGDIGTPSRILCGRFGSPWTYATFHHERVLAPGQLSFQQMSEIYHYDQIDESTAVYGVIADPIGHSLSPQVHNAAFRHAGVNAVYLPFRVPAETLDQFLGQADAWGIRGLSVTIPHKEAVLRKLVKFDPAVKGIGAANTIVFEKTPEGTQMIGYNTDYRAALDSLDRAMQPPEYDRGQVEGKTVLVLGAGGAARAIVYGLKRRGANVIVAGRTAARAEQLADPDAMPRRRLVRAAFRLARRAHQLHAGRHASKCRRNAVREAPSAAVDGRVRHGLQSREHAVGEGRPQSKLHGDHRRRDVRPPGELAIHALHRQR